MTLASEAEAQVQFDHEGYVVDASQWTTGLAETLAGELGITLSPEHWEAIHFVRQDFAETGKSPGLRRIATNTSVTIKDLYRLFPKGPGKLVAKIAGVPKPKSCL